jgi:thiol-disulfide isomerase/thioredoxin
MLKILNEIDFKDYIKNGLKLVMIGSDLCKYCKKEEPILQELGSSEINIGKIDAYKFPKITQEYGITSFPTFLLFKHGDILTRFSGFHTKSELLDEVLNYL